MNTSGQNVTSGVEIPPELAISEAELMSLSVEELEKYISRVSSIAVDEYSSIQGFNSESLYYQTLMDQTQSTIDALDIELITANNLSTTLYIKEQGLIDTIANYTSIITQYDNDIAEASSIMVEADNTINTLEEEDAGLVKQLEESDSTFKAQAKLYSSLVYAFLGKQAEYESHMSELADTTSSLQSTIDADFILNPIYESTLSTFNGIEAEIAYYTEEDIRLNGILSGAEQAVIDAQRNLKSSIDSVKYLSSLYETAVINQEYSISFSTLTYYQEQVVEAENMLAAAETQYVQAGGANQNSGANTAVSMARSLVEQRKAEEGRLSTIADTLARSLNTQVNTAYDTLIDGIQRNIRQEFETISSFVYAKENAIKERDRYSSLMEIALSDMQGYIQESSFHTSNYLSSLDGITVLERLEATQQSEIISDNLSIAILNVTLSNLSTQLLEYCSSFYGWSTLSSIYYSSYMGYLGESTFFDEAEVSTAKGIADLTAEKNVLVNDTIPALEAEIKTQSAIERSATIRERQYQAVTGKYYGGMERAAYQYRETFLREKRLQAQEDYENYVTAEIQRVSSMAVEGNTQAYSALNLNTLEIQTAYAKFTSINSYLDAFDTLYDKYSKSIEQLGKLEVAADAEHTATMLMEQASDETSIQRYAGEAAAERQKQLNAAEEFAKEEAATVALRQQIEAGFRAEFQATVLASHEQEVSSIIISAMA